MGELWEARQGSLEGGDWRVGLWREEGLEGGGLEGRRAGERLGRRAWREGIGGWGSRGRRGWREGVEP